MRRLLQNTSVNGHLSQKIQEKKQFFLVSGTVFVAHLFEVRSITVIDFSFYFTLTQACSVTKLEFQRFYKSFIEILLISLFFKMESLNQISGKPHRLVSTLENYRSENLSAT